MSKTAKKLTKQLKATAAITLALGITLPMATPASAATQADTNAKAAAVETKENDAEKTASTAVTEKTKDSTKTDVTAVNEKKDTTPVVEQKEVQNNIAASANTVSSVKNAENQSEEVNFPDANLRKHINECLKQPADAKIYKSQLKDVTFLHFQLDNITSFEGLQYCENLSNITCYSCSVENLEPLMAISNKLSSLSLWYHQDASKKPRYLDDVIKNSTNLYMLSLLNTGFNNISYLKDHKRLRDLSLNNTDFSSQDLKQLNNLTKLSLSNNTLSSKNLEDINTLTSLVTLSLSSDNLETMPKLDNLKNLKTLYLNSNHLTNFNEVHKELSKLPSLDYASIGDQKEIRATYNYNNPDDMVRYKLPFSIPDGMFVKLSTQSDSDYYDATTNEIVLKADNYSSKSYEVKVDSNENANRGTHYSVLVTLIKGDNPAKPDPVKPDPVKPDPVKPDPVKPDPVTPVTPTEPAKPSGPVVVKPTENTQPQAVKPQSHKPKTSDAGVIGTIALGLSSLATAFAAKRKHRK